MCGGNDITPSSGSVEILADNDVVGGLNSGHRDGTGGQKAAKREKNA